ELAPEWLRIAQRLVVQTEEAPDGDAVAEVGPTPGKVAAVQLRFPVERLRFLPPDDGNRRIERPGRVFAHGAVDVPVPGEAHRVGDERYAHVVPYGLGFRRCRLPGPLPEHAPDRTDHRPGGRTRQKPGPPPGPPDRLTSTLVPGLPYHGPEQAFPRPQVDRPLPFRAEAQRPGQSPDERTGGAEVCIPVRGVDQREQLHHLARAPQLPGNLVGHGAAIAEPAQEIRSHRL